MTWKYDLPFPGVGTQRMAHSDYHRVDAYNASRIKVLAEGGSLKHLYHYDTTAKLPTADMLLGTAVHARVLEAADFKKRALTIPTLKPKAIAKTFAEHQAQHPDAIVLADGWAERIEAMYTALTEHEAANRRLSSKGFNEMAYFWTERGLPCRAKPDRVVPGFGFVDLKTTGKSLAEFEQTARDLCYWVSAAWYTRAWYRLHGKGMTPSYMLVAVETEPPHNVGVYEYTEPAIETGWIACDDALGKIKEAGYPDNVPGYTAKTRLLDIGWTARQYENRQPSVRLEDVQ